MQTRRLQTFPIPCRGIFVLLRFFEAGKKYQNVLADSIYVAKNFFINVNKSLRCIRRFGRVRCDSQL